MTDPLIHHMSQCMHYHRRHFRDPACMPPGKVLDMATIDAAQALGLGDDLGSPEPGKNADTVLIDMRKPHLWPPNMPVTRLAHFANAADVETVIVDGRVLMRAGRPIGVDETELLDQAKSELARGEAEGMDGFVVACFDDPAIGARRELATGPVVGICEAAMHAASMIVSSFSVVTTLPRSAPIVEELAMRYGMARRCRGVRAADLPVLALKEDPEARSRILAEVRAAVTEDRCEAVILGCAGLADLVRWLSMEAGVPVIDGVVAGVRLVEALAGAEFNTSKTGAYAAPRKKPMA